MGRLGQAPIWIDDNPNLTIMEIRAKARRLKSQVGKLGMIVIDYLQLMTGRSSAENRQVEVSELSRGLKILARELETPVVALSQLSRNLEMRADKRPMLADLRESGSLEQDCRRRDVHLPRGDLRREAGERRAGRHHRGQAPLRPHRHRAARVPPAVHPLRQHGAGASTESSSLLRLRGHGDCGGRTELLRERMLDLAGAADPAHPGAHLPGVDGEGAARPTSAAWPPTCSAATSRKRAPSRGSRRRWRRGPTAPSTSIADEWRTTGPQVDELCAALGDGVAQLIFDTVTHEQDLRGALGQPGGEDGAVDGRRSAGRPAPGAVDEAPTAGIAPDPGRRGRGGPGRRRSGRRRRPRPLEALRGPHRAPQPRRSCAPIRGTATSSRGCPPSPGGRSSRRRSGAVRAAVLGADRPRRGDRDLPAVEAAAGDRRQPLPHAAGDHRGRCRRHRHRRRHHRR